MHKGDTKQVMLVTGVAMIVGAFLPGCASKSTVTSWQANGTPVHESPTESWWNYELVYHPNSGVFFEPYSHMYHWEENGEWRSSKTRPEPVTWRADEAIIVRLNWDTPEYAFDSVAALHPNRRSWDRTIPITVESTVGPDSTALTTVTDMDSSQPE